MTRRLAGGVQAGEQDGALDLRRRHRQRVFDRDEARPTRARRAAAVASALDLEAHLLQWAEHAAHRAAAERSVAVDAAPSCRGRR